MLLDALVAAAILGLVGSSVLTIATGTLDRQGQALDRSVALVASRSLVQQYILLGTVMAEDELFRYEIVLGPTVEGTSLLRQAAVIATPRGLGATLQLEFLAPVPLL